MLQEFAVLWVSLAAFVGALVFWLIGWLKSNEEFAAKKFGLSAALALVGAVGFGVLYNVSQGVDIEDLALAFLAGAGWEGVSYFGLKALRPDTSSETG